ncbi:protein far1-related sequence 8 [Phtheirospermum japonicum]|uniref:Protein FAR1-RELATED SEQUENCE n=1 Tax=Phtheirospermum japonicum TaxID=374723 RepID=A0A830BVL2_9LAMI|nr:protein far1-related sequence 8 [Phtheirospermum japonicum]
MIRLRLVESNRWRLDEVKSDHNHLFDHQRAQNSRSHKKTEAGAKRKLESAVDLEVRTIKLYRTPAVDSLSYGSSNEREFINNHADQSKRFDFKNGHDVGAIHSYFCRAQLADPNFFYIMDLSDEGYLRNVFWIESRSRAAYGCFGDVVVVDKKSKHDIPFLSFSGVNHHCRLVLFGCGLIVDETLETYVWLMRAWLTCMSGRPPLTIVTDRCKALQGAISEVFPRANHRFCPPLVVKNIYENLGWDEMTQHFGIKDHEWLRGVYDDREKWVPVYLKNTFFAGVFTFKPGEQHVNPYFHMYLHNQTNLNEFFNSYESLQQKMIRNEAIDDLESREFKPVLKTACNYEFSISHLYTKQIFLKFQDEVALMSSICFGLEVRCVCGCFNFRGYLCRHALCVLNYNGIEEIPSQYVLSRWRKDIRRFYCPDFGSDSIDISNPVQWFDHLYRRAVQVVTEGMGSEDRRMVAWQAFKESLNKVRLATEKRL